MEIGIRIPHTGPLADRAEIRRWCEFADEAGFGCLWGVDHIVMPQRVTSEYVLGRRPAVIADDAVSSTLSPNFEMLTTLAFAAAVTERIRLGTAVAVLTIRNALLAARQLATIDRYSNGRLVYGVGVGWLREEADAMNMPWDRRGARADEHIDLLRTLWTASGSHVSYGGEFWTVPPMDPEPLPVQRPIPILVGGHSPPAMDRAARLGDGWIAADVSPGRLSELLPLLHEAAARHGRDPATIPVYCGTGRRAGTTVGLDDVRRYEALRVHSLQVAVDSFDDLRRVADAILPTYGVS